MKQRHDAKTLNATLGASPISSLLGFSSSILPFSLGTLDIGLYYRSGTILLPSVACSPPPPQLASLFLAIAGEMKPRRIRPGRRRIH